MFKSVGQYIWAVLLLVVVCCNLLQAASLMPGRVKRTLHQFHDDDGEGAEPEFVHDSQYLPEEVTAFEGHTPSESSSSSSFGHEGFDIHDESVHSEFHEKPVRGINHGKGAFSYSTLYASKEIE